VKVSIGLCSAAVFCRVCGIKGAVLSGICSLKRLWLGLEGSVFVVGMRVHLGVLLLQHIMREKGKVVLMGSILLYTIRKITTTI